MVLLNGFFLGIACEGWYPNFCLPFFQVNGDTIFMTGNFKEFKVENHANDTWDEHNAIASTAVCISFFSKMRLIFSVLSLPSITYLEFIFFRTILPALILQHKRIWI